MPERKAARLDWERYKDIIRTLYLDEGRKLLGPGGVKEEMEIRHQFFATKAQYETQFRKWKFRKNITSEDWVAISQQVAVRKRENKDTQVLFDGKIIPQAKVRKEILRRVPPWNYGIDLRDAIRETSAAIRLRTPPADLRNTFLMDNLPSVQVQSLLVLGECETFRTSVHPDIVSYVAKQFRVNTNLEVFEQIMKSMMPGRFTLDGYINLANPTIFLIVNNFIDGLFDRFNGKLPEEAARVRNIYQWIKQQAKAEQLGFIAPASYPAVEVLVEKLFNWSIEAQDVEMVRMTLQAGRDPNVVLSSLAQRHRTPLSRACQSRNLDMTTILLKAGACMITTSRGRNETASVTQLYSPIEWVIYGSSEKIQFGKGYGPPSNYNRSTTKPITATLIGLLLDHGAKLNSTSSSWLLCIACWQADASLAKLAISEGADVNQWVQKPASKAFRALFPGNHPFINPLASALSNRSGIVDNDIIEVIGVLLDAGADINIRQQSDPISTNIRSVLSLAVSLGSRCILKYLLGKGMHVVSDAMQYAQSVAVARLLLRNGGQVTQDVLNMVTKRGKLALLAYLLKHYPPHLVATKVIASAVKSGCIEVVELVLSVNSKPSSGSTNRRYALKTSLLCGQIEMAKHLFQKDVHLTGTDLSDILSRTVSEEHSVDVFRLLFDPEFGDRATITGAINGHLLDAACGIGADNPKQNQPGTYHRRAEILRILLQHGVDKCKLRVSGVLAAIYTEDASLAKSLVRAGAAIQLGKSGYHHGGHKGLGWCALRAAVNLGDQSLVLDMVRAGADVNATVNDSSALPPLSVAIQRHDFSMVRCLVELGANVNISLRVRDEVRPTPLETAVKTGDAAMVELLLQMGARPNNDDALRAAVLRADDSIVKILLATRRRLSIPTQQATGCSALQAAIDIESRFMIETLLENGTRTDIILREHMIRPDETKGWVSPSCLRFVQFGTSSFGKAIERDGSEDLGIIRMMLEGGADPNGLAGISPPRTPLLMAVQRGNLAVIQLLIGAGADVNALAEYGRPFTPLQLAAQGGNKQILELLLRHGADPNASPAALNGATALQFAALNGFCGIAQTLLEAGADVNAPPAMVNGRTALEGAAEHGRIDMLQLLLNTDTEDGFGAEQYNRAIDFAKSNGYWTAKKLLERHCRNRFTIPGELTWEGVFDAGDDSQCISTPAPDEHSYHAVFRSFVEPTLLDNEDQPDVNTVEIPQPTANTEFQMDEVQMASSEFRV